MGPDTVHALRDVLSHHPVAVPIGGNVSRVFLPEADGSWTLCDAIPQFEPMPEALELHTLQGLVDYFTTNRDALSVDSSTIVQVVSPAEVRVLGSLYHDSAQRPLYARATFKRDEFAFGRFLEAEGFIIALQSTMAPGGDREAVLRYVSQIDDGVVRTSDDDSVRQETTIRQGITRRGTQAVPNPVTLAPFRTFSEVEQPASVFILRARSGEPQPLLALFEADGGAWKIEAIGRVATWLREKLPEGVAVLA